VSAIADRAVLLAADAGVSAARMLPERVAYGVFRVAGDAMWRRRGPAVRRLEANLSRVLGPGPVDEATLRRVSRAGVRSYMRYWCDAVRLPGWSGDEIVRRVRLIDEQRLREPIEQGRGAIAALPHMGNWDLAGAWGCLTVSPLMTVAERLRPEELYEKFLAFRRGLGMTVLPLTGGNGTMAMLGDHLRAGKLVALPADRDLSRRGVPVTMFGEATRMPPGPALLALRTGSPVVPASLWYEGKEPDHRLVVRFHEEITPPEPIGDSGSVGDSVSLMTQRLADVFAAAIAEHPDEWHMMQRYFLSDLRPDDPRRMAAVRS
jgi:KDO2-lipid IV(A) lauroyltransferase